MTDIDTVSNKILEHRECQQKFKNKKSRKRRPAMKSQP